MANWYYYPQSGTKCALINLDHVAYITKGKHVPSYDGDKSKDYGHPFFIEFAFLSVGSHFEQTYSSVVWKTEEARDKEWELLQARLT
ncbi:MAG TPA: hypothetical protein VGO11_09400 [Chthoniobacteraceae bacterium]|jgi:hypothetical protein|nr:hypothetical protein [Chthoniobacteraceae bacterium]